MIPFYLEIPDDSRLDSRNSAFSALAGFLDVQDMVAHAENMQFIEEDGTVTEGTFMEYADGLDLVKKPEQHKHLAADPLPMGSETRGQFLSSLADLAVADFLGMNMDRHAGNVIYQVDQEGHLTGVKAIDNDASFGPAVFHKGSVRDLRVISKDMALTVSKLTPDMLKFSLRGHGLSEKEIECAGKRLKQLQDALTQNKLRVVDKEKFKDIDWNICLPRGNGTNIFSEVLPYVEKVVERNAENKVPFEPYQKPASPDLPEVSATNRRGTVASFTESLERISKKVVDEFFEGLDPQSVQGKDDRLSNETRRELERRRAEAKPAEGPLPG